LCRFPDGTNRRQIDLEHLIRHCRRAAALENNTEACFFSSKKITIECPEGGEAYG
jgi:hypothetical protein